MPTQPHAPLTSGSEFSVAPALSRAEGAPRRRTAADEPTLSDYLHMLRKRWRLIALVFGAVFFLAAVVIAFQPPIYRADVLVVVQAPSVRTSNQVIPIDSRQKLDALKEQVVSRRTMEEVIKKFDLYPEMRQTASPEAAYTAMSKAITFKLEPSSFNLYFEHPDPRIAADVANELARRFIAESMRLRKESLQNSAAFINKQMTRLEAQVKTVEAEQEEFRKQNMGALPEDVPANQALLIALTNQVSQTEVNLDSERQRKHRAEDRITDLVHKELAQRQKQAEVLRTNLKHFPDPGVPLLEASQPAAGAAAGAPSTRATIVAVPTADLEDRRQELERALATARTIFGPNSAEALRRTQELAELKNGSGDPEGARSAGDKAVLTELDEPEVESMREQLRSRDQAVKDSERNVSDLEKLVHQGMTSEFTFKRAQSELEQNRGNLRVIRAQVLRARNKLVEDLKDNDAQLAQLIDFQAQWSELLLKIQELDTQRLRIAPGAPEESVRDATARIGQMSAQVVFLRGKLGETFDTLLAGRGELAQQMQEHENVMTSLNRQQADLLSAKTRIVDLDRRLTNAAKVQVELPAMGRRLKTVSDQYEILLRRKLEADLASGVDDQQEGERMIVWDPAIPTTQPYKPKFALLFGGSALAALALALGLALLLELMAPKYLNPDNLHNQTGLEVLARIEEVRAGDIPKSVPEGLPQSCAKLLTLTDGRHRVSRQFLDCACMLLKGHDHRPRVMAVVSPGQGDGKTFVAANLAAALAISSQEPVLLIDTNFRSPALHALLGYPLQGGLAEALEGGAVQTHLIPGPGACSLRLMTAGCNQAYGATLLGSTRFREMMDDLTFDGQKPRIILDTPALSSGADVDMLLEGVDGVLLVVRRGHTAIADVGRILRRIRPEKLLGTIYNADVVNDFGLWKKR